LDNNVASPVESISNIRGHSALTKKASPMFGDIVFFRKTIPDFRGHSIVLKGTYGIGNNGAMHS